MRKVILSILFAATLVSFTAPSYAGIGCVFGRVNVEALRRISSVVILAGGSIGGFGVGDIAWVFNRNWPEAYTANAIDLGIGVGAMAIGAVTLDAQSDSEIFPDLVASEASEFSMTEDEFMAYNSAFVQLREFEEYVRLNPKVLEQELLTIYEKIPESARRASEKVVTHLWELLRDSR